MDAGTHQISMNKCITNPCLFDLLIQVAGGWVAPLKKSVTSSVEWAGLEQAENMKLTEFINGLESNKSGTSNILNPSSFKG